VPSPSVPWPKNKPFNTGRKGRDSEPAETAAVEALRRAGQTSTVGDPVRRARLVYHQNGETCALAVQAEVLAELHGLDPGSKGMRALEDKLYEEAVRKGYFEGDVADPRTRWKGGTTPNQYMGSLLGVPVRRTALASPEQLDAAVKTGKMLIVNGNTGTLWNDPKFANGGHAFVVTGAEVRRDTGEVLGYYINDTGTNEGGRFVARGQFMKAWQANGRLLLEPQ
jgi:hypothetical protein